MIKIIPFKPRPEVPDTKDKEHKGTVAAIAPDAERLKETVHDRGFPLSEGRFLKTMVGLRKGSALKRMIAWIKHPKEGTSEGDQSSERKG